MSLVHLVTVRRPLALQESWQKFVNLIQVQLVLVFRQDFAVLAESDIKICQFFMHHKANPERGLTYGPSCLVLSY